MMQPIYKKKHNNNQILVTFDETDNFYLLFLNGKGIGGEYSKFDKETYNDFLKYIMEIVDTLLEHDNLQALIDEVGANNDSNR